jgi:hypothetical protein
MENWTSLQTRYLGGADRPRLQSAAHSRTRAAADGRRIRARRDGLVAHGRGDFDRQIQEGRAGRVTELKASVTHAGNPHNDIVVDAVDAVAKEVGVKPGQVAVAWVKAKGVLPVIGTRTYEQLVDHLGALEVVLSDEHMRRLDAVTAVALGYPHDLNNSAERRAIMTRGRFDQIDYPVRVVR